MWRRAFCFPSLKSFSSSSSSSEIPTLYSFLQPTVFAPRRFPSLSEKPKRENDRKAAQTLMIDKTAIESDLKRAIQEQNTDEAWKLFKTLTNNSILPCKQLSETLISYLTSLNEIHNLKRAFASVIFLLEKNPGCLTLDSVHTLLHSMKSLNSVPPAFALLKSMFRNGFFPPFSLWGDVLIEMCRKNGNFAPFLEIFSKNCEIALEQKLDSMRPNLDACNVALEFSCELGSVNDAEHILEIMSDLDLKPNDSSFGSLSYLYASKGMKDKILELEKLMDEFGFSRERHLYTGLIKGFVKSGDLESISTTILQMLQDYHSKDSMFGEETYCMVVKAFLSNGRIKELVKLIVDAQDIESSQSLNGITSSIGYGIVNACVELGLLEKAHNILEEMNAQGVSIGLGVYISVLKAYCKERRTAEAAQLVIIIKSLGMELDADTYDSLVDTSMSIQDFQSAFSLFRDMRETKELDLKMSYLTIMTGLMENHRPELMAAFLDQVIGDPRIEVGTHDWNSTIHAFCKLGRLEDARRTFRRMTFLRFEPNEQTYLSLINGYVAGEKYFSVLMLWTEVRKRISVNAVSGFKFDHNLVDAFLHALVKGGYFDAVMQVVEKIQEMKIFVDKWRYKQAYMETHKKLKIAKLRRRNNKKMEAVIAFKNWAGLNA